MKVKCPNCGHIIFYDMRDPENKRLNLEEKRKRDRLEDRQDQATTLNLATYHWDKWGSDEIDYLSRSIKDKTRVEIALYLGRTLYSVGSMLRKLRRISAIPRGKINFEQRSEAER